MKRTRHLILLFLLLSVLAVLPAATAAATTVTVSGYCGGEGDGTNLTWILDSSGTLTISGTGTMIGNQDSVDIPWRSVREEIKRCLILPGVSSIGKYAFAECVGLTGISIPEGVTRIEEAAFWRCNRLASITLPESVTLIGAQAYTGCSSLTSISIPEGVTGIGDKAFDNCSSLTDVYYGGSDSAWKEIMIGSDNDPLLNADIHYGSRPSPIAKQSDFLATAARYVPYSEAVPAMYAESSFSLASGALPKGLSLSADGLISGIPTELGGFSFIITESDQGGTITHECSLFVYTQYSIDVEAFNQPGYGFVETAADDGRVQDQTVRAREELKTQIMCLEGDYSEFRALYLDARLLTRGADYYVQEGRTRLAIPAKTIGEAGGGTHTLAAEFVGADGRAVFTVQNYTVEGLAGREVRVTVEGKPILWTDAEPYIDENSRTMAPFRAVGEALSLSVAWNSSTREASFTDGARTIFFPIGSTTARTSDGGTLEMDTGAVIINGRTYAPIRYLAEFFGRNVSWDSKTRTASIR